METWQFVVGLLSLIISVVFTICGAGWGVMRYALSLQASLKDSVRGLTTEISSLARELAVLGSGVSNLKASVDRLTDDVDQLNTRAQDLNNRVIRLESRESGPGHTYKRG